MSNGDSREVEVARDQTVIAGALAKLDRMISDLACSVDALCVNLIPAMRERVISPAEPGPTEPPMHPASELVNLIRSNTERVSTILNQVGDAINRLEV